MTKFKMQVSCDNAAFEDLGAGLSYVLYKLSSRFNDDENGNTVGDWMVSKK